MIRSLSVKETTARSWHFKYDVPFGWAIFTVNDNTGEFIIISDWGNYTHRWDIKHLGVPTLTEFLSKAGEHYIVDKLSYDMPREFKEEIQWNRIQTGLQRDIIQKRQEQILDRYGARLLWEQAIDFCTNGEENGITEAYRCAPEALSTRFCLSEYIVRGPSDTYCFIRDHLIPDFQNYIREVVLKKR